MLPICCLATASLAVLVAATSPGVAIPTASAGVAPFAVATSAPTPDALAYDDPGMHFRAPDGWTRVDLDRTLASSARDTAPPAAVFAYHAGQRDQRTIVIRIEAYAGSLDDLVNSKEIELRSASAGLFVDKKAKTTLSNGMPAYIVKSSQPDARAGEQMRRYDYVVGDLSRGIDVAFVGRYGDFDESDVRAALSSLSVVVYPQGRR
ncbi:MAG: hypothetical protein NVS1B2_05530 [Vulcanimicrobiaceae bacterium]